ncbi:MAG: c-type cytochrome [Deltaproteobacteria bacterium]|nr:c-type cytochrome [Deltaproteobacteria bacterium]
METSRVLGVILAGMLALAASACSSSDSGGMGPTGGSGGNAGSAGSAGQDAGGGSAGSQSDAGDASAEGGAAGDSGIEDATEEEASTPAQRGEYLVKHVSACGDCHTPRKQDGSPDLAKWLAGNPGMFEVPGLGPDGGVGIVSPKNLTPDVATGLGSWTDAQIKSAILDGVDDEGKALFPIMPYYVFHNMTSEDADAIVAYLKTIPAVSNAIPENNFDTPAPAPPVPAAEIPDTTLATTDPGYASAVRGKYLASSVAPCMECHTLHVQTPGAVPLDMTKAFAGGEPFYSAAMHLPPIFPPVIYSANITPDTTGLAGWAPDNIVTVLHQGVDKDGHSVCPPMPVGPQGAFGGMSSIDALDIANYLLSIAPKVNDVPKCEPSDGGPPPADASTE